MEERTRRELLGAALVALGAPREPKRAVPTMRRKDFEAAYLRLERTGELAERARALWAIYQSCRLCPRQCGVNRLKGEKGVCQAVSRVKVSSAHPHFGEERPLVGRGGSGTIFFSHCNLLCCFCQNWGISHRGEGSYLSDDSLGRMMADLQGIGCHNINVVTPTHCVPNIVQGLRAAIRLGLRVPLVYNCGGYEPVEILKLLDGIVDIYLPDFKYTDGAMSEKYSSGAKDYPEVAAAAHVEMHRQVGELIVDENGMALRGLLIRHLVMPNNIAGTEKFVQFVAQKLTRSTYVNIMAQYRPEYKAREYPELSRRLTTAEYQQAVAWAREAGLTRLD
jgi:putative pyruvate formate lyase activating enzyme